MMLEDMLEDLGLRTVGPAMTVGQALSLLNDERPDAAILDINVGGETSSPVAERLADLGIPFAFATGYSSGPDLIAGTAPLLQKPYAEQELARLLGILLVAS
jgi:CheY-like chemotaxis protein